mgnify:CR=1 FL=1|jgi:ABC-type Mn2+/Zn2+ transport system ATPase subunit
MLEVNNITIERKGNLLYKNLSFKVEPGKLLHLKGMNGSGKSSLLQALIGDLRPKEGEVLVDGKMVKSAREIAREFGYLPQELKIDFPISVHEYLLLAKPKKDITRILNLLDLENLKDKKITEISLGQLQRVQFAQLLVQNPNIFLLDEPFSAQDDFKKGIILGILEDLKKDQKMVILTHHLQMEIVKIVDQTIELKVNPI